MSDRDREPIAAVAAQAATAAQADLMVALLRAEGIPATVEGSALADEVAIARRAMHLSGLKVWVPSNLLEQARAVLAPTDLGEDELAAQALAAAPEPGCASGEAPASLGSLPGPRAVRRTSMLLLLPFLLPVLAMAIAAITGLVRFLGS